MWNAFVKRQKQPTQEVCTINAGAQAVWSSMKEQGTTLTPEKYNNDLERSKEKVIDKIPDKKKSK